MNELRNLASLPSTLHWMASLTGDGVAITALRPSQGLKEFTRDEERALTKRLDQRILPM